MIGGRVSKSIARRRRPCENDLMRALVALLLGMFPIIAVAIPAEAATPAFELQADVADDTVIVRVTFLQPMPVGIEGSGVLEQLIGVAPAEDLGEGGRPTPEADIHLLSLREVEGDGIYGSELKVGPGRWAVVPWPLVSEFDPEQNPGVPATLFVVVGSSPTAWVIGASVAFVGVAIVARTLSRIRSKSLANRDS